MKKILVALVALCFTFGVKAQDNNADTLKQPILSPHHFTMSLGYGFSLSDKHDALFLNYNSDDSHNSKMRHGINYRFDYDYNFDKNLAFGIIFNMYNSFDSYYVGGYEESSASDDRWLFYVGPSFIAHTNMLDEHWSLFAKATVGLMNFRNAQRTISEVTTGSGTTPFIEGSTTYKRYTFGYGLTAGADYYINQYFSIDASISYLGGSVSKVKDASQTYELDDNENLSRLNINVGVKIKL